LLLAITKAIKRKMKTISNANAIFDEIFDLAAKYNATSKPVRSSNGLGIDIVKALKKLAAFIQSYLNDIKKESYVITISKGQSNVPRLLYVAVSLKSDSLSVEPSVTICFAENGDGCVVGMMYPEAYRRAGLTSLIKVKKNTLIDLSSSRSKYNFNDCFANPLELCKGQIDEAKLLKHLTKSLALLDKEHENGN
jgi:hypothetical protein